MKSSNRHQRHSNSNSHSPSNRSRSREREREREKERTHNRDNERERNRERDRDRNNNNREHNKHQHNSNHDSGNISEGKLYLTNIPINTPEHKVKEEFERFGTVIDYSLRKKLNIASPYYFGHITLSKKQEAEKAIEYIRKNLNWYVEFFEKDRNKDKNSNKNKKDQNNTSNNKQENNIAVREILVKNLPNSTTEANLYKEFFVFGEISKIELKNGNDNKKYAFIKYRLISSAIKACEEMKNMNFNGNMIKVNFSNIAQRKDIKGNEEGYELNENNCKLVIVSLNKNCKPPKDDIILKIFENFGKIKNFAVKNLSKNKPNIYIEYYKPEDAKKAIEEFNNDSNLENRKLLGDEKCEINFYFKTKSHEVKVNPFTYDVNNLNNMNNMNNMNMFQNNILYKNMMMQNNMMGLGMNNPALMLQMMQKNLLNNQFNLNVNNLQNQKPFFNNNLNIQTQEQNTENNNNTQNINITNKQTINNPLNNLNISNNPLLIKNQLSKMPFPFINSPIYSGFPGMNYQQQTQDSLPNYQIQNQYSLSMLLNNQNLASVINNNYKNQNNNLNNNLNNNNLNNNNTNNNDNKDVKDLLKKIMNDKNNQNKSNNNNKNNGSDSDISSLNGSQSAEEMDFEKEYSLEEENLKYIWNGFLTKNNKDRVNVDLYQIRGKVDDTYFKEYHLNICNRIQYEEVMKRHLLGIVAISPQNVTQREIFDDYVNYLDEKQRCGVINVSEKYILYLASPGEFSRKFYQNPKKHLLGLLVDATVEPNLYVDMNNLALPPPVISLTERRRLMSKDKRFQNETRKDNKNNDKDIIMKLKEELKKKFENKGEESEENMNNYEEFIKQNPEIKDIIDKLNKKDE